MESKLGFWSKYNAPFIKCSIPWLFTKAPYGGLMLTPLQDNTGGSVPPSYKQLRNDFQPFVTLGTRMKSRADGQQLFSVKHKPNTSKFRV